MLPGPVNAPPAGGVVEWLLGLGEPSVTLKLRTRVLGLDEASPESRELQLRVKESPRVRALLAERTADGTIPYHPYTKWYGAHWVLATLADIGYPPGDTSLLPLRDQVYAWLLGPAHRRSIREIDGRVRRCASQEGNALFASLALGLADERADTLAERLVRWQWPDGGWNCDRRPEARHSSFMETLIPLRALARHARATGNRASEAAAARAVEVFLKRRLFRRRRDGAVIDEEFTRLHYPCYWRYDILFALKVMAEAGFIGDPRCQEALDLLESKRLAGGGFPAEGRFWRLTQRRTSGRELVDWGPTGRTRPNPWVTVDALYVLRAAGRVLALGQG
ncbi:MAG: hypothetical protein AB1609_09835 [Bacillota bacterium]